MGMESSMLGSGAGDFLVGLSSVDPVAERLSAAVGSYGSKKGVADLNPSSGSPSNTARPLLLAGSPSTRYGQLGCLVARRTMTLLLSKQRAGDCWHFQGVCRRAALFVSPAKVSKRQERS